MELQQFISSNQDYINVFKKNGFKVRKYKNTILVKNDYNKPLTFNDENDYWKMYCRGAVIDTTKDRVVCLPPAKGIEITLSELSNEIDSDSTCEVQHLIDGTMINLFFINDKWTISTRSEVGGYNKWSDKKSFRKMFEECCDFDYQKMNPNYSYSFVMRHKENRNVSPVERNELYLVEIYDYSNNSIRRLRVEEYPNDILTIQNTSPPIELPKDYACKGITIKRNNKRYKITNPEFERIKQFKINSNNLLIAYLELRKNGSLKEYLQYFPENSEIFKTYQTQLHELSNELYSIYKNVFIYKKKEKKEIPYYLNPLVSDIHQTYLETKKPTSWNDIKNYIHNLPSKKTAFALSYRKKNIT